MINFTQKNVFKSLLALSLFCVSNVGFAQNLNIIQQSQKPYAGTSNIWGYVDTLNNEYALVGASNGLSIVDVSKANTPVEKFFIPGPNSIWREIRSWGKYAYVTTEGGGGVTIVDMRFLPDTVFYRQYTGDGVMTNHIDEIHALHIDNGKLYLYGGNYQSGKAKMFSLADPWNPQYLGTVSNRYVHDGFVKNDTLYSCQIYDGLLEIIDATNPSNPVVINSQITPLQFTHNSWMSTNKKVVYTTDEVSGSYVTAYDISDLNNIKELDRYRHNNSGSIGHNTYILNNSTVTGTNTDWLWTSYYTDGITLVDASRPDNLVEVGYYDSSPNFTGGNFHGAWGVYPYLPSGNVLISDMENGLHVVKPTYKRACFLEGTVKDAQTQALLVGAEIKVLNKAELNSTSSNLGTFKTGTVDTGTYVVEITHPGYEKRVLNNVVLQNGLVTTLNIELSNLPFLELTMQVKDEQNAAITDADVLFENASYKFEYKTNSTGTVKIPIFYLGKYNIYIGKFGYYTLRYDSLSIFDPSQIPSVVLKKGYQDDFMFTNSWLNTSTATAGDWVRAIPIKTSVGGVTANPDKDVATDNGSYCFVTGNATGSVTTADIDNGTVELYSPSMNLSTYINPYISFSRWFSNLSSSSTPDDTFSVYISNGAQLALIDQVIGNNVAERGKWVNKKIRVLDYIPLGSNMKIKVKASDLPGSDQITEAGFDDMYVSDSSALGLDNQTKNIFLNVFPNPSNGEIQIHYHLVNTLKNAKVEIIDMQGRKLDEQAILNNTDHMNYKFEHAGLYLVRIINGDKTNLLKVLIN